MLRAGRLQTQQKIAVRIVCLCLRSTVLNIHVTILSFHGSFLDDNVIFHTHAPTRGENLTTRHEAGPQLPPYTIVIPDVLHIDGPWFSINEGRRCRDK